MFKILFIAIESGYSKGLCSNFEMVPFFFKILIFDGCFGKYRLNLLFLDNIGRYFYFLKYDLPTPPLRYCFLF